MKVLIVGAGGFIGSHAAKAISAAGHEVMASALDFTRTLKPELWFGALRGIDAVVNAAGIFRETRSATFDAVHVDGPCALFAACEAVGIRRVIQVSALGADEHAQSRFHLSKRRADDFLRSRKLAWTIVQPSLVFGMEGASARLFARMAALPVVPLPGEGDQRVQPIHVDDLAELILRLIEQGPPRREIVAAVGPRALSIREWLVMLRAQMKLGRARTMRVPLGLVRLVVGSETLGMLVRGNIADASSMERILGRRARDAADFVKMEEADLLAVRAKVTGLLPVIRAAVAATWIVSGIVSLGLYPVQDSYALLARVGLAGGPATLALYGAAALDIALGVLVYAWRSRWLWRAQLALIAAYTALLTAFIPELWLHPFGPLLKNLPLAAAILLLYELEDRA